jgi:hypothetical protein
MSPAQQQAMWQQYQSQTHQLNHELSSLARSHTGELSRIQKIQNDLKTQYAMMSPFNASTGLDSSNQTSPYSQPMNQQSLQFNPNQPFGNLGFGKGNFGQGNFGFNQGNPAFNQGNPAFNQGNPTGATSTCQSTADGGRCMLTLQAPAGSGSTCKLIGQSDGNLVVYNSASAPIWATGTNGKGVPPYYLTLQPNGNLAWTDSTGTVLWQTNTSNQGVAPYTTSIAANCNVQLNDSQSKVLWQTNSYSQ